jgi:hypothetical protein
MLLAHSNEGWPCVADKKLPGKSRDEQMAEKKQELEKRLQDVTGQLGSAKKPPKKGNIFGDWNESVEKLLHLW